MPIHTDLRDKIHAEKFCKEETKKSASLMQDTLFLMNIFVKDYTSEVSDFSVFSSESSISSASS
jgi:hypothetical protein